VQRVTRGRRWGEGAEGCRHPATLTRHDGSTHTRNGAAECRLALVASMARMTRQGDERRIVADCPTCLQNEHYATLPTRDTRREANRCGGSHIAAREVATPSSLAVLALCPVPRPALCLPRPMFYAVLAFFHCAAEKNKKNIYARASCRNMLVRNELVFLG